MEQGKGKEAICKEAEMLPPRNVSGESDDKRNSRVLLETMDTDLDATCIEDCMSFLLVTIKVRWHCQLDFYQHTGHSFICLSLTISETIFGLRFSEIQLTLHYILFSWENI